jgi:hypothetical protein
MLTEEELPENVRLAITTETHLAVLRSNPKLLRFIASRNSASTIRHYVKWIINVVGKDPDLWALEAKADPEKAEQQLIDYVIAAKSRTNPRTGRKPQLVSIVNTLSPLRSFLEFNRVLLAWGSVRSAIGKPRYVSPDRPPTREEIQAFMKEADIRMRFVATAQVSMGGRVGIFYFPRATGGFGYMALKDVAMIDVRDGRETTVLKWLDLEHEEGSWIARVTVYAGETEQYPSFWSVEAVDNWRVYLDSRVRYGELLDDDSPAVRDKWDASSRDGARSPIIVTEKAIESATFDVWGRTGVKRAAIDGGFKSSHGFRKYFETEGKRCVGMSIEDEGMENRISPEDVEILKGARMHYNKPARYLQKVFLLIMPRLLVDGKYSERYLRVEAEERHRSDFDGVRLELLEMKEKSREKDKDVAELRRMVDELASGRVKWKDPAAT